jgi:hypothetical protein
MVFKFGFTVQVASGTDAEASFKPFKKEEGR